MQGKQSSRIAELDGLRAIAITLVILYHLSRVLFRGASMGVDIFFVISGYIITAGLLAERRRDGNISIKKFYLRRVRRIWPALIATVIFTLVSGAVIGENYLKPAGEALGSFMNWALAFRFADPGLPALNHTWSLSTEEQFYLVWPLTLTLILRWRRNSVVCALAVAIAAVTAWRYVLHFSGAPFERIHFAFDTRADQLLIGCLLAMIGARRLPALLSRMWFVPAAMLALVALLLPARVPLMATAGYTVIGISSAWLVTAAVEPVPIFSRLMTLPFVQWAGLRSYSLYLWHYPIYHLIDIANLPFVLKSVLLVAFTAFAAEISYRFIETPFLKRRVPDSASGFAAALRPAD